MPGLTLSNEWISRDEGFHEGFACEIYLLLQARGMGLTRERILEIVLSGIQLEKKFACEALPVRLIGMNADSMCQYVEYCADYLLQLLGQEVYFKVDCPFEFMVMISLPNKNNLHERRSSDYKLAHTNHHHHHHAVPKSILPTQEEHGTHDPLQDGGETPATDTFLSETDF